jgi:DNA-binding YbaB/EbfC family protein
MKNVTGKGMMKQLQRLQEQLLDAQAQLAEETVSASVGGGMVTVTFTGDQKCTAIKINPEILEDDDVELLQDLILSAVNTALDDARQMAQEQLGPLAGGMF